MPDTNDKGRCFLRALQERGAIAQPVCAVLAHPDDETIGLGAQLPRLKNLTHVLVTDGAPRNGQDATRLGFAGPEDYAQARARELREVLRLAKVPDGRLLRLDIPDQQAPFCVPEVVERLASFMRDSRPEVVVTHAYEGGHPDHDATALAVHLACRQVPEALRPAIVEVPLYHLGPGGRTAQQFLPVAGIAEVEIALDPDARAFKQKLFEAHASQASVLGWFGTERERFRLAPDYDFAALPNGGSLLYEQFGWDFDGARWQDLAHAALSRFAEIKAA
jgi:LmbE family N-acetylglucosaminyl deacetylase